MNVFKDKAGVVYYTGLLLLVIGLPLSLFLMSIAQFVLLAAFIMEQNYRQRLQNFLISIPMLALTGLYLMHLGGLIFTSNFSWAGHDLKVKLPLLLMPFLIGTSKPLSKKQFETLLWVFNGAVLAGSLIAMAVLVGIIARPVNDIRDIFIFNVSHIRFSLLTCLSIFSLAYFLVKNYHRWSWIKKIVAFLLCIWFIVFLVIAESMTGITILLLTSLLLAVYFLFQKKNIFLRLAVAAVVALGIFSLYQFFAETYSELTVVHNEGIENPERLTALGNPYEHRRWETDRENGYLLWMYLCEDELRSAWNKRSAFPYDSLDMRKQDIRFTLIRFLTSKGWRKDADAVNELTDDEVHSIEKGIANVNYQNVTGLRSRLRQIFWEYDKFSHGGNPQGHSVTQRMEFWKAAYGIFKEHFFFGTGTGDIVDAYKLQYEKMDSDLAPKYRLRAHNQYLTFAATFGIFGLLYFIFTLVYPMRAQNKTRDFLYVTFWLTAVLSMITEDTLETQAGVTFFAFFNCLYLFARDDAE